MTALAGVMVLSYGGVASYAAGSARGGVPTYADAPASATPHPSSREPDRAGSRAGEGRARPGRADTGEEGSVASYAAGSARGRVPTYADAPASATPHPSSREPDRAGSRAGEGRARPGRADTGEDATAQDPEGEDVSGGDTDTEDGELEAGDADHGDDSASRPADAPVPVTSAPPDSVRQAAAQGERADGPVLQILPLGSGLVLVGLGIALAIAALRLRRG